MVALAESMTGDHPARPALVLANSDDAGGLEKARKMGIDTAVVDHKPFGRDRAAFEAKLIETIDPHAPDIICHAGFMRILTERYVNHYDGRMLNIHPSLLPKYTGLNTHARALDAGDTEAGCTVHEVTSKLDDGPILGRGTVQILSDDTPESLAARVLRMEHQLYPAVLRRFAEGDRSIVTLRDPSLPISSGGR